jgi:hypothetical protein
MLQKRMRMHGEKMLVNAHNLLIEIKAEVAAEARMHQKALITARMTRAKLVSFP